MSYNSENESHRERNRRYQREWYQKNKQRHIENVELYKQKYKQEVKTYVSSLKQAGCSKCSEKHPACLEFHHLDPSQKEFEISTAMANNLSLVRIKSEIAKCIILCANCHRKLHWEENK